MAPSDESTSKNLAHLLADLFAKPLDGEEFPAKIQRLGDEIRKIVRGDETIVGKFRDLLTSFEPIIPDERQRHQAALQALCTTAKLNRQQILKAMSDQIEQLRALEKEAMPAENTWRDAMKGMTARLQQLKGEIAQVREKLAKLETEERPLLAGIARQEAVLAQAEKAVKDLFATIAEEVAALRRKVEEAAAETPTSQAGAKPAPPKTEPPKTKAAKSEAPSSRKPESRAEQAPPLQETKYQRKCPMCGGPFNRLEFEKTWQCYVCAYEEPD